jgi:hypothetical protein
MSSKPEKIKENIKQEMKTVPAYGQNNETKNEGLNIMWRAFLLRVLYYLFFVFIFVMAFFIFLKLVNFYFYIPSLENFLNNFISSLNI